MDVSISKLKAVIEELRVVERNLKTEIAAYEKVMLEYVKKGNYGYDKIPFKKVLDDMNEQHGVMKQYIRVLEEVIDCYEKTEKKIVNNSIKQSGRNFTLGNLDTGQVKGILDDYQIKFI